MELRKKSQRLSQGKGKTRPEFIGEYGREKGDGARTESFTGPTMPVISYGISDNMDITRRVHETINWSS